MVVNLFPNLGAFQRTRQKPITVLPNKIAEPMGCWGWDGHSLYFIFLLSCRMITQEIFIFELRLKILTLKCLPFRASSWRAPWPSWFRVWFLELQLVLPGGLVDWEGFLNAHDLAFRFWDPQPGPDFLRNAGEINNCVRYLFLGIIKFLQKLTTFRGATSTKGWKSFLFLKPPSPQENNFALAIYFLSS